MTLGIDVACRAAHQASLADESGRFAWSGPRFRMLAQLTCDSCGSRSRPEPR